MPSLGYCIIVVIGIRRLHSIFKFSVSKFLMHSHTSQKSLAFDSVLGVEEANSVLSTGYAGNNGHQDVHKKQSKCDISVLRVHFNKPFLRRIGTLILPCLSLVSKSIQ